MATSQYFSIHAHFYQPPREDPLTGLIPNEKGASPFPNWNERIHAECYRPNAELRNFNRISFNIGPTLIDWMVEHDPATFRSIVNQDQENYRRYGSGNALAQAYNHTILPLATYQDKVTQIFWGITEFEHHFGRKPQGLWLPETAVDYQTLEVLVDHGIEFTILAAWQAKTPKIDVTEPYQVSLPSGRKITVFFFQPELSAGISFNPTLTVNADSFAQNSLTPYFNPRKKQLDEPQLILLASDGELYGHHQPFRERFLARLVDGASSLAGLGNTYPASWLKLHPPRHSTALNEATSWSCHHGVKRWTGECACTPGDNSWKNNFRKACDHLAQTLDALYFRELIKVVKDPWMLRNDYIYVFLKQITVPELINRHAGCKQSDDVIRRSQFLLESQRERQRMYTSCGWFFEDFHRIEPQNNIAYAVQALHLARLATGIDLEPNFLKELRGVVSPITGLRGDLVGYQHARRLRSESGSNI